MHVDSSHQETLIILLRMTQHLQIDHVFAMDLSVSLHFLHCWGNSLSLGVSLSVYLSSICCIPIFWVLTRTLTCMPVATFECLLLCTWSSCQYWNWSGYYIWMLYKIFVKLTRKREKIYSFCLKLFKVMLLLREHL